MTPSNKKRVFKVADKANCGYLLYIPLQAKGREEVQRIN